ncbi:glutaredoxin 2 [Basfia succiniciproducens]|uniref:GrxB protein n=1 Tax=Mannheimia succiniciproducens (strain KCTC 0769BP / MBEL55E) TaxID=221988 RepID=Q65TQ1_MANSM|nr:glutaredoxin 2 [[Mannheimia] succiniciproducens]AAU37659.1 GrxB protein [[Mannheimia] succiniciproducens MBEL55E]
MKLYVYEHCPFCVRARMIFGLKNLPFEQEVLSNDDEATPTSLVGKKVVPILVKDDGTAMPESLDIVKYVDENFGDKLLTEQIRPELEVQLKQIGSYYNHLLLPRFVKLGLAEYNTQSALNYFIQKKTKSIGDFAENLANTPQYLDKLNRDLTLLDNLILAQDKVNGEQLSVEDIILFPMLRNLTCVKGVIFPTRVKNYVDCMAKMSKIDLFYGNAV